MSSNRTNSPPASTTLVLDNNAALAEHANAIRLLDKQTVENVVEIGRHLVEAKAEIRKLGLSWGDWLKAEFKWSDQQARRFMHISERKSQLNNLLNADLPVSALYLLAAPSTPTEARDEIIERAEAGEPVSVAETKHVIDTAKGRKQSSRKPRKPITKSQAGKGAGGHKKVFGETIVDIDEAGFDVLDVPLKPAYERIARKLHNEFGKAPGEVQHHFVRHFLGYWDCDIGADSADVITRKNAEIDNLREKLRAAEIKIVRLESEIEELRGKPATAGGDPVSVSAFS